MLKIIIGPKGTGKTKALVDMINNDANVAKGKIVCITRGQRLLYDIKHSIRLIDVDGYDVSDYRAFYGFICGVMSSDFDISDIYIESITKVVNCDLAQFSNFIQPLNDLAEKSGVNFTVALSAVKSDLPENLTQYYNDTFQ